MRIKASFREATRFNATFRSVTRLNATFGVVANFIPSNYGRITRVGNSILVS